MTKTSVFLRMMKINYFPCKWMTSMNLDRMYAKRWELLLLFFDLWLAAWITEINLSFHEFLCSNKRGIRKLFIVFGNFYLLPVFVYFFQVIRGSGKFLQLA